MSLRSLLQVSKISLKSDFIHFFHDSIHVHVYIPEAGADNPSGTEFFRSTGTSCHFGHLLQVLKTCLKSDFIHFFLMILYMYIAPGQGQTTPSGQRFGVNRNVLSLHSFVAS